MLQYRQRAMLCLLLVSSRLVKLRHVCKAYVFFFGFICCGSYCRRWCKVPCAEYRVLVDYLLHIQISVAMVEIYISVEGKKKGRG